LIGFGFCLPLIVLSLLRRAGPSFSLEPSPPSPYTLAWGPLIEAKCCAARQVQSQHGKPIVIPPLLLLFSRFFIYNHLACDVDDKRKGFFWSFISHLVIRIAWRPAGGEGDLGDQEA
jgi:hypothetical protein